jgi:hypothetical protein
LTNALKNLFFEPFSYFNNSYLQQSPTAGTKQCGHTATNYLQVHIYIPVFRHTKSNYIHGKYLFLFVGHGRMENMDKVYPDGYNDVEKHLERKKDVNCVLDTRFIQLALAPGASCAYFRTSSGHTRTVNLVTVNPIKEDPV